MTKQRPKQNPDAKPQVKVLSAWQPSDSEAIVIEAAPAQSHVLSDDDDEDDRTAFRL
jgi:hypothetical protein